MFPGVAYPIDRHLILALRLCISEYSLLNLPLQATRNIGICRDNRPLHFPSIARQKPVAVLKLNVHHAGGRWDSRSNTWDCQLVKEIIENFEDLLNWPEVNVLTYYFDVR